MTTPRTAASAARQGLATGQFLLICMQPFGAAVLVTVVLVLETWARPLPVLAPGAAWRLALPGALGALALWALVWWQLRRRALHPQWRKAGAALSLASSVVDAISSARPCAIFAMMFAVAGATRTRSLVRDRSIWSIHPCLSKVSV